MPIHNAARLRLPRPALGSCIYLGVERDTRALKLSDAQRFNHYPATPLPTISWVFDGQLHLVDADPSDGVTFTAALPALTFSGPRLQPTSSWSPAPVHAMTVAFYPDALYKLFKIRANDFIGRTVPLGGVLEGPLLDRFIEVGQAGVMDPFLRLEESLQTIWDDALGSAALPTLRAWVQSMAVRAAFSRPGASLRGAQRWFKDRTGQSHRDLQLYVRTERAMAGAAVPAGQPPPDLAAVAAGAGYAVQSHLGREVRRVTGWSPGRLGELMKTEEPFWFYRLLGEHLGRESANGCR